MTRTLLGGIACLALVVGATPALGTEATSAEVRELAERAVDDPAAVEELREIDSVDGRPVDYGTALGTVSGVELDRRLHSLAEGSESNGAPEQSGSVNPDLARREAREVLGQGKFKESDIPKPFKGVLDTIGDGLRKVGSWFAELADDITGGNPRWILWGLLAFAAAVGVVVGRRLIHRRARKSRPAGLELDADEKLDPYDLEAAADAAERDGRLEEGIRLRFRAGLIRLGRARAIPARASLTSGDIAQLLRSKRFEEVAATFDEVVYGRRAPLPEDVEISRAGWRSIIQEKTRS